MNIPVDAYTKPAAAHLRREDFADACADQSADTRAMSADELSEIAWRLDRDAYWALEAAVEKINELIVAEGVI